VLKKILLIAITRRSEKDDEGYKGARMAPGWARDLSLWRSEMDLSALDTEPTSEIFRHRVCPRISSSDDDGRTIGRSVDWLAGQSSTAFMHRRPMSLNAINMITMSQGRNATAFARADLRTLTHLGRCRLI